MIRRLTSLTALFSFALVLVTSVVLYIVPAGRVAYWADWRLWGMTKEQWGALHINLGTLFLLTLLLHAWYNWKAVMGYLKSKAREAFRPSLELLWASALTLVFTAGTLAGVPPFSSFLGLNTWFKDEAVRTYGEPPYGHAELSPLPTFVQKIGLDLPATLEKLTAAGIKPSDDKESVGSIAARHGISPQRLFHIMQGAAPGKAPGAGQVELPPMPPSGTGQLALADFCAKHGLDQEAAIAALAAGGIPAKGEMTLKQIAQAAGRGPADVYDILRRMTESGGQEKPGK